MNETLIYITVSVSFIPFVMCSRGTRTLGKPESYVFGGQDVVERRKEEEYARMRESIGVCKLTEQYQIVFKRTKPGPHDSPSYNCVLSTTR